MDRQNIILRPIITEKSIREGGAGFFTFEVANWSTKTEIKRAVEENFNVKTLDVKTSIIKGKRKRVGRRRQKKTISSWKKAIVKLASGQKIDLFEGLEHEQKT